MLSLHFILIFSKSQLTIIFYLNHLGRNFVIVAPGAHKRMPNGILGLLCKLHYPSRMQIAGQLQPASSWEHYIAAEVRRDREGREYPNKAQRVLNELWVSLTGTTFLNTSYSLYILKILTSFAFMCRISTDARRECYRGRRR